MASSPSSQFFGGLALMVAAFAGIVLANTPLADAYDELFKTRVVVQVGELVIDKALLLWVNDGLMAVFFLLVALELKREVLDGTLSRLDQIALPAAAAIGGIAVPASIYLLVNIGDATATQGWAIPAATDIAFALGVLAMLGDRVPTALKAFLLSVAVFDDLGAIVIIATFYTDDILWPAKAMALVFAIGLFVLNRAKVWRVGPYILIGIALWVCVLKSGVHATLAGVLVGLMIPHRLECPRGGTPLSVTEHALQPWVAFGIVPVFALANSGVSLSGLSTSIVDPVALGVGGGLLVGKMVGVFGASALVIRLGWAKMPKGATWMSLFGVSVLAGIGFTMSLFIGTLAFEHAERDFGAPVRLGVLAGSLLSAVFGVCLLRATLRSQVDAGESRQV